MNPLDPSLYIQSNESRYWIHFIGSNEIDPMDALTKNEIHIIGCKRFGCSVLFSLDPLEANGSIGSCEMGLMGPQFETIGYNCLIDPLIDYRSIIDPCINRSIDPLMDPLEFLFS